MDFKYSELRIIGWYHSHPDFGIFLSDRDVFIQQHFFGSPGQIALVVDPVRKLEGVFEWRSGRPELMDHYWVGNQVQSIAASRTSETPRGVNREASAGSSQRFETSATGHGAPVPWTVTLLSCICLFLIGWMLSGTINHSRAYQSWAIERYGLWNILQIGRNQEIAEVQSDVNMLRGDISQLSREHMETAEDDKEAAAALRKRWKEALTRIAMSQKKLDRLQSLYGLSPEDEQLALTVVVDQLSRLRDTDPRLMLPIPVPERFYSMLTTRLQTTESGPKKADPKKQEATEKAGKTGNGVSKPKAKTPAGPAPSSGAGPAGPTNVNQ